jgi:Ca-activated chloride channel family protein
MAWFLPAAFAVLAVIALLRRRKFLAVTAVWALAPRTDRASRLRRLPAALAGAALAFITAALMEPVLPYTDSDTESRGVDIVLVLDLSSSMQETMNRARPPTTMANLTFSTKDSVTPRAPAGPTRLEATKAALMDFVAHRPTDRIGLIVFSDNAYVVSPLTVDHEYLRAYIQMIDDQILRGEGMTAIGEGIFLANQVLARQSSGADRRNRVIVVFTDGEHNHGRDPIPAIGESDQAATRVHLVGVDLEEEVKQKPQVLKLIETVRQYGGRYFTADTTGQLRAAYLAIDEIEKGVLVTKRYVRNAPVFHWFAIPALLAVALAVATSAVPYFIDLT